MQPRSAGLAERDLPIRGFQPFGLQPPVNGYATPLRGGGGAGESKLKLAPGVGAGGGWGLLS